MKKLLIREMKLSASLLSYLFIAFGAMALIPGYPILVGAFFVSFGLFHSFQVARENNDVSFSLLLPVAKADVVRSKFIFCVFIEMCGFALMTALTLVRMTVLRDAVVYRSNVMMNANLVFLGFVLVIFGCFHLIFVRGYFKTAYYFARPFVKYIIAAFLVIGCGEALHHIPGLEGVNAFGFENLALQAAALGCGALLYVLMTVAAVRGSIRSFEKIDL